MGGATRKKTQATAKRKYENFLQPYSTHTGTHTHTYKNIAPKRPETKSNERKIVRKNMCARTKHGDARGVAKDGKILQSIVGKMKIHNQRKKESRREKKTTRARRTERDRVKCHQTRFHITYFLSERSVCIIFSFSFCACV